MRLNKFNKSRIAGFTLVEVMIVVAIIGILAAIAIPNYNRYVLHSYRVEARNALQDIAQRMQQNYSISRSYIKDANGKTIDWNSTIDSVGLNKLPVGNSGSSVRYDVSVTAKDASFIVTATAVHAQVNDECKKFSLNQANVRTANDEGSRSDSSISCWRG